MLVFLLLTVWSEIISTWLDNDPIWRDPESSTSLAAFVVSAYFGVRVLAKGGAPAAMIGDTRDHCLQLLSWDSGALFERRPAMIRSIATTKNSLFVGAWGKLRR
ncbi:MAG: hypothetical protein OEN02_00125 [Gammaproteobacteria bacterium]|nr:hypothetical protein [Gammaproteobacteria bacterium]